MDSRERFLACMRFDLADRAPNWEMGYWAATLARWYEEGLCRPLNDRADLLPGDGVKGEGFPWRRSEPRDLAVHAALEFDEGIEQIDGEWGPWPPFEPKVLNEDAHTITRLQPDGTVQRTLLDGASVPQVISWPVSDRESWERLKVERFRIDPTGRLPADWPAQRAAYARRTWPLAIGGPFLGVFSALRTLLGFQRMMYAFYDEPALVDDILAHLTMLWLALFEEVLDQTTVDLAYFWEDMSYKGGAMISPRIFRRFLLPVYRSITSLFRSRGIHIILVDTDGWVWDLIPLLLEGGITGLYPFEVRAGMDVAEVRKAYPRLQMLGGIDKKIGRAHV